MILIGQKNSSYSMIIYGFCNAHQKSIIIRVSKLIHLKASDSLSYKFLKTDDSINLKLMEINS